MLIQCPSCQARATVSDDHEGARVRCAECGRICVARPRGSAVPKGARAGAWPAALRGALALLGAVREDEGEKVLRRNRRRRSTTR